MQSWHMCRHMQTFIPYATILTWNLDHQVYLVEALRKIILLQSIFIPSLYILHLKTMQIFVTVVAFFFLIHSMEMFCNRDLVSV